MRLLLDTLVAIMLTALLGGVMWHHRNIQTTTHDRETTRAEVRRFKQQISLQSALATVERNERGYPDTINPEWFVGNLPANALLDDTHPWLEVAGPEERDQMHPTQPVATNNTIAKFWFNPNNGIVRARVPVALSDTAALETYMFVNECTMPELFAKGFDVKP